MPICARCFSMLLGYLAIPILFFIVFPWWIGLVLQVPMLIDGWTQRKGLRKSTNLLRVLTGLGSGIGISALVVTAANAVTGIL